MSNEPPSRALAIHMAWRIIWVWGSIAAAAYAWGWLAGLAAWVAVWLASYFFDHVVLTMPLAQQWDAQQGAEKR